MGGFSLWHWVLVAVVAIVLFGGRGKISAIMGDVAKGIKSFKKGLAEDDPAIAQSPELTPLRPIALPPDRAAEKPSEPGQPT